MISEKTIMDIIEKYAESESGKKQIKEKYGIDYDGKTLRKYGKRMKEILYQAIKGVMSEQNSRGGDAHQSFSSFPEDGIIVGNVTKGKGGILTVKISFSDEAISRDSFTAGSGGLKNIILLFTKGYNIDSAHLPRGNWRGQSVVAKKHREPNDFLQRAIDKFNTEVGGDAIAVLADEYKQ